jgi:UDP-N-acetylglucosamine--N-acetylmuramyl-(pentapeptide) pyrophosphoryl-undecaprenol N-acetylglucosamine transferase
MVTYPARILLAAGGTGGHVYPAIAVAESLHQLDPKIEIRFCCGNRPAELEIYRKLDVDPWILPVSYNRPGLLNRLRFLWEMTRGLAAARRHLKMNPIGVVMGFGSFVSVPPVLAAHFSGAKVLLHESNIQAGAANRFLKRFSQRVAVAHPELVAVFGPDITVCTGNPVRQAILMPADPVAARQELGLQSGQPVCLCVGGSQGSRELNSLIVDYLRESTEQRDPGWRLLWATGSAHFEPVMNELGRLNIPTGGHCIVPYLDNMATGYSACDLVLARGGALTQSEITARGLPAILAPLKTRDNHQVQNARRLEEVGAAVVLADLADPSVQEHFRGLLTRWHTAPDSLSDMAEASRQIGHPDAASTLARILLDSLAKASAP